MNNINMMNVQEIRRNVINVVKNYSDAQVKVRKATSNEPWGPSSTLMSEIADLTYNVVAFSEIMQIVWKRLNDHGKNWRHVYKALVLLEYLIKTGSEKVAQQCRDNLFAIQTLKDFQYFEENKDQGLSIREKSKLLVALLKDEEKLKNERTRALKAKERFAQSISYAGNSSENSDLSKPSTSFHESLSSNAENIDNSARSAVDTELENARPQTVGEEELQLQLALAMSKEEAEQEERLRKNDDLRLKLALHESEKNAPNQQVETRSAVDDLLSLAPVLVESEDVTTDPWGTALNNNASLFALPHNKSKIQESWEPSVIANVSNFENKISSFDDPWASNSKPISANNDPWSVKDTVSNIATYNDPWNSVSASNTSESKTKMDLSDLTGLTNGPSNDSIRRTPESFLGPNSNLVNLDALVSNKQQTSASPNNNPFAPVASPPSNPFQTGKPSQPTINQLRAQTNQLGAPSNVQSVIFSNANSLNSLFNTPSATTSSITTSMQNNFEPNFPTNSVSAVQMSGPGWANFATQPQANMPSTSPRQNNPFAM